MAWGKSLATMSPEESLWPSRHPSANGAGITSGTFYASLKPVSPCGRRHCGGSVLSLAGNTACLLCARPHGVDAAIDLGREPGLPTRSASRQGRTGRYSLVD